MARTESDSSEEIERPRVPASGDKRRLDESKILDTAERLRSRIQERFPLAGLASVADTLCEISRETQATIRWIARPNYFLRSFIILLILALLAGLIFIGSHVRSDSGSLELGNFIQISEAAINDVLLLGAAIAFLISLENRTKRKRVIRALNELRTIAHVIDMHQLTKDPYLVTHEEIPATSSSIKRQLTEPLLQRYLDYCSEMLSITSKIGFLYAQHFDDQRCLDAVHDLEDLCTGLSRKIWQKILILSKSGDCD